MKRDRRFRKDLSERNSQLNIQQSEICWSWIGFNGVLKESMEFPNNMDFWNKKLLVDIPTGSGDHGCRNSIIVEFPSPDSHEGVVVDEVNCTSCWQVGHGQDHQQGDIGNIITIAIPAREFAKLY